MATVSESSQSVIIAYWSEEKGTQPSLLFRWKGFMTCSLPKALAENDLLPNLLPFNGINPRSVDNASIHHVDQVIDLVENQAGAKLLFLPPYSPLLTRLKSRYSVKWKAPWKQMTNCFSTKNTAINCNYRRELFKPHIKQWLHLACSFQ